MTTASPHLSIGEVLTLLQDDFPDVTISKIRFLESQGLLVPERTPSGYRKFHDDDIDRLRWILTQQRDHFLPLKVIKERIENGDLGSGPPEGVLPFTREAEASDGASSAPTSDAAASGPSADDGSDPVDGAAAVPTAPAAPAVPSAAADEVAAPDGGNRPTRSSGKGTSGRGANVAELLEGPAPATDAAPTPKRNRRRHPSDHVKGEPAVTDVPSGEAEVPDERETFTRSELAERSGMGTRGIAELEKFGLVVPHELGGTEYFDDDALAVALLAAGFSRYGIEPRHLRMYKVSAEREAGMFEQLIMPLLKQRRAAAREEAVEMLEDLAELADDLRAVMVRTALRGYLGGA